MRIYIDNSSLNRPFDDCSQPQIKLEAMAIVMILDLTEQNLLSLVNSDIIEYENLKNPLLENKQWVENYLKEASYFQKFNAQIEKRAQELEQQSIDSIDALHLSSAEKARVDYFITSDSKIPRKYQGQLTVLGPLDFIRKIQQKL